MTGGSIIRRLRGALGNALVWGGGWFALGFVGFNALLLAGLLPETMWWADGLLVAARFGMAGFVVGGAFSSVIGLLYRGRRLSEISWVRFGIAGGIVAGLFVPAFLQAMNWLSGDGFVPMQYVLDDALWTAAFGGIVAGGSLKLAQRADTALPGGSQDPQLGRPRSADRLAPGGEWDGVARPAAERSRSARG